MARVTAVVTGTTISSTTFGNALITDYISQTDTTEQNLASNLNIGANLLKTTNLAIKQMDANTLGMRDSGDTAYRDITARYGNFSTAITTNTIADYSGGLTTFNNDIAIGAYKTGRTITGETLGVGATTFAVTGEAMEITGDGGANTVATITGGRTGQILILTFVDGLVTITDTDAHGANTVDLAGNATDLVSADDTMLTLFFDGTSWYEMCRSVNS